MGAFACVDVTLICRLRDAGTRTGVGTRRSSGTRASGSSTVRPQGYTGGTRSCTGNVLERRATADAHSTPAEPFLVVGLPHPSDAFRLPPGILLSAAANMLSATTAPPLPSFLVLPFLQGATFPPARLTRWSRSSTSSSTTCARCVYPAASLRKTIKLLLDKAELASHL